MRRTIWISVPILGILLGSFVIYIPPACAQSAREIRCDAHKEAKRFLGQEKFLDQAGGDARQAAILICTGKYGQALDAKCIEWEEKILRAQIRQVEAEIAKDCR
jgi:hypothetical protein